LRTAVSGLYTRRDEDLRVTIRTQADHAQMAAESRDAGNDARPVFDWKAPNVTQERHIEPIRTAFSQIRTGPTISYNRALQHATHADATWIVDPHQSIGARHSDIESCWHSATAEIVAAAVDASLRPTATVRTGSFVALDSPRVKAGDASRSQNIRTPGLSVDSTRGERSRLRVARTSEFNGFNNDIRDDRVRPLVRWTRELSPDVSTGRVVPWAGLRPMLPDMFPRVGAGRRSRVFYNIGHGHLGWTLSATGTVD
jgi:hypothetical protein